MAGGPIGTNLGTAAPGVAAGARATRGHGGYHPVAVDLTGFWRLRRHNGPTTQYHGVAGRALPALPGGLSARVGSVGGRRLALPLAFVRADAGDRDTRDTFTGRFTRYVPPGNNHSGIASLDLTLSTTELTMIYTADGSDQPLQPPGNVAPGLHGAHHAVRHL